MTSPIRLGRWDIKMIFLGFSVLENRWIDDRVGSQYIKIIDILRSFRCLRSWKSMNNWPSGKTRYQDNRYRSLDLFSFLSSWKSMNRWQSRKTGYQDNSISLDPFRFLSSWKLVKCGKTGLYTFGDLLVVLYVAK